MKKYINDKDHFQPVLVVDDEEESRQAIQALEAACIKFDIWDTKDMLPNGRPPYLLRGQIKYLGLNQIRQFINNYPGILHAEEELKKPA
jgi:hypothetical protein